MNVWLKILKLNIVLQ